MRPSLAISLLTAVLSLAPAVSAQSPASVPLTSTVGSPIAYRVDLPTGWKTLEQEDGMLTVGTEQLMIVVGAVDMMGGEESSLSVSEAEWRRSVMNAITGSDSAMLALLTGAAEAVRQDGEFRDVVREIRSLGGQRSAVMRGRIIGDEAAAIEVNITARDGVMYMLAFSATDADEFAAHEPLFARIRDSVVLAPAPR
jgi:hypothetical protein